MDGKQLGILIVTVLSFLASNGWQWYERGRVTEWKDTYKERAHKYRSSTRDLAGELLSLRESIESGEFCPPMAEEP